MPKYSKNTTLRESYLCVGCVFKNDKVLCQRLQRHKWGCAILNNRRINDLNGS